MMVIEIETPVFKCADDSNIFFARLAELPGYDCVIGKDESLSLHVAEGAEEAVLVELQKVCDVWNTRWEIRAEE